MSKYITHFGRTGIRESKKNDVIIRQLLRLTLVGVLISVLGGLAAAQLSVTTIPAGTYTEAVAVNPVTNKVYVVNYGSNNMTIFDPLTSTTATVAVGSRPSAVVVNPVTNKVYVANEYNIIVVDGNTPAATQTVATGGASCLAVNPTTNTIFACVSGGVAIIDGATNTFTTLTTGKTSGYRARLIAVNAKLNRIYVGNSDWTFNVIDMENNSNTQLDVPWVATAIAVNPQTDRVYVSANNMSVGHLIVMDGAGSSVADYPAGTIATAVAVNPATNKVYVTNHYTNETTYKDDVLVLDGDAGTLTTLATGGNGGRAAAVNPVTNQVYVLRDLDTNVTVIDGSTDAISVVTVGRTLWDLAVNTTTGQVFATNRDDGSFAVIGDGAPTNVTVKETNLIGPWEIAVNPVTNQVYVANSGSNSTPGPVTIIDGDTNAVKSVTATIGERVVVDPATNRVYIGHGSTTTLAIFDGATEQYSTVYYQDLAKMALNPNDNKLYLVNYGPNVSVLDPATRQLSTIAIGGRGQFLAVNPATNKIYVTNDANTVVIDGSTKQVVKTITDAARPGAISVNPRTNRIYVSNTYDSTLSVIDGTDDTVIAHLTLSLYPAMSVVNPETNRVYIVESGNIKVMDGATNTIAASINMQCSTGCQIYINPAINQVYVTQSSYDRIAVIDGATNQATYVATGDGPIAVAINPVNNKVYVANYYDDSILVLGTSVPQNPLKTTVQPLAGDVTGDPAPIMKFTASNGFTPHAAEVQNVFYQVDSWLGPWVKTRYADGLFAAQLDTLWPGTHTLYAFATDGSDATALGRSVELVGGISTYSFSVTSSAAPPVIPVLEVSPATMTFNAVVGGTNPTWQSMTIENTGGGTATWTAAKTQSWLSLDQASGTAPSSVKVTVDATDLLPGNYSDEITVTSTGSTGSPKTVAVMLTVEPSPPALSVDMTSLVLSATVGGTNPASQPVAITNAGGGTLSWTVAKTQAWLSFDAVSGTGAATLHVSANISGLAVGTYHDTITISAAGATGSPKAVDVTLTVQTTPDFQMSMGTGSSASATVTAGGTAFYTIMVAPVNNFSGMVTMSCSGLPSASYCTFTPSQQMVTGTTAMPFSLQVTTAQRFITGGIMSSAPDRPWIGPGIAVTLLLGTVLLLVVRRQPRLVLATAVLLMVAGLGACGGNKSPTTITGTPAGTYPITVTATSGTMTHTTMLTLTVN